MRCKMASSFPAADEETLIVAVSPNALTEALYGVRDSFGWTHSCICLLQGG